MVKLLIIADDFTGALDTGIQFAMAGASTKIILYENNDFQNDLQDVQVIVVDAESRHLQKQAAYQIVLDIVKQGVKANIPYIYKKTDSGLRGNIGSELSALLKGTNQSFLPFIPAFPQMNRITKAGVHYMEGVPIAESVFGRDPFEPVHCSYVPDIIKSQTEVLVEVAESTAWPEVIEEQQRIIVYNSETLADIRAIADKLKNHNQLHIMAGCAGFASILPEILGLNGQIPTLPRFQQKFLIVCGSVNEITKAQLAHGEKNGFKRINLSPEQKLSKDYYQSNEGKQFLQQLKSMYREASRVIVDTNDLMIPDETKEYAQKMGLSLAEVRVRIADTLGYITKELLKESMATNLLLTGGDTLMGFTKTMNCSGIKPVYEMAPGTVLSELIIEGTPFYVISKSGGFGNIELFTDLDDQMRSQVEKENDRIEYIYAKNTAGSL